MSNSDGVLGVEQKKRVGRQTCGVRILNWLTRLAAFRLRNRLRGWLEKSAPTINDKVRKNNWNIVKTDREMQVIDTSQGAILLFRN